MKITIKDGKGTNLWIPIPNWLLANRIIARFALPALAQNGITITMQQADVFLRALRSYRRRHKDWVLVEVYQADGQYVKIKM